MCQGFPAGGTLFFEKDFKSRNYVKQFEKS
jgi:hypothetical protein